MSLVQFLTPLFRSRETITHSNATFSDKTRCARLIYIHING